MTWQLDCRSLPEPPLGTSRSTAPSAMPSPRSAGRSGITRFLVCPGSTGMLSKSHASSGNAPRRPSPMPRSSIKSSLEDAGRRRSTIWPVWTVWMGAVQCHFSANLHCSRFSNRPLTYVKPLSKPSKPSKPSNSNRYPNGMSGRVAQSRSGTALPSLGRSPVPTITVLEMMAGVASEWRTNLSPLVSCQCPVSGNPALLTNFECVAIYQLLQWVIW
jgi:hypothetical protein